MQWAHLADSSLSARDHAVGKHHLARRLRRPRSLSAIRRGVVLNFKCVRLSVQLMQKKQSHATVCFLPSLVHFRASCYFHKPTKALRRPRLVSCELMNHTFDYTGHHLVPEDPIRVTTVGV